MNTHNHTNSMSNTVVKGEVTEVGEVDEAVEAVEVDEVDEAVFPVNMERGVKAKSNLMGAWCTETIREGVVG